MPDDERRILQRDVEDDRLVTFQVLKSTLQIFTGESVVRGVQSDECVKGAAYSVLSIPLLELSSLTEGLSALGKMERQGAFPS